ncbi:MAG: InlB B-repeat-containing protein [Clostridia bacterium]|nr:InlB B-repeat-containing protein [Clostridia bacterium]
MNKTKSILRRSLTLLLTLLMLLSTTTLGLSAAQLDIADTEANVDLAETGYDLKCVFIYDNSKTKWSSVQLMVGHSSWSQGYMMTKIANTDLWYYNMNSTWGGATHIGVFNASSTWGGEGNSVSHRLGYADKNSSAKALSGNMTDGIQLLTSPSSATSTTDNFTLTTTYHSSYSSLNTTQTATVQSADKGSTSYANDSAAGTTSISTYKMSSNTGSTSSTGTTSASAARTATVTMTATANSGYTFKGWYNSSGTLQTSSTTLTYVCSGSAATYYARFEKEPSEHTVTFVDWDGTETEVTVQDGGSATAPTPKDNKVGYHFVRWDKDFSNVTGDLTVNAVYEINQYDITVSKNADSGNSTVSASASKVDHGGEVTFTATADAANRYVFTGWTVNGVDMGLTNPLTITNITEDTEAVASFQQIPTYTVRGVVGLAGAGTVSPTQQEVPEGSMINLTAIPNDGYTFTGWTIQGTYTPQSGSVNDQSFSIVVNSDVTATANFRANTATVRFAAGNGGTVTNSGANTVTHPATATSTATANPGYTFNNWTVTGGTLNTDYTMSTNGTSVTITPLKDGADLTVTANFTINTYTVEFVDYDGTVLKTQTVEYGEGATAPADPTREGYTFNGWDKTFANITANTTVNATYVANTYTVGVTYTDGGTAEASASSVTYPNTVTLTATPSNADYIFNGWAITGAYDIVEGTTSSSTFVIRPKANITAQAKFAEGQYLTIHTYSDMGYDYLYAWEKETSTSNAVDLNGAWPGTLQNDTTDFNGVTWKTSEQLELTPGYSYEVGAILGGGTSADTVIYVDFSAAGSNWGSGHYLSITASSNSGKNMNATDTSGAGSYVPQNDTWLGSGTLVSGSTYKWTIPSANLTALKNYGFTVWSVNESTYGQVWQVDVSHVAYSTTYNTYTIGSSNTRHGDRQSDCFTLTASSNTTHKTDDIILTDYLYEGDSWKGVSEVWITDTGAVTLRRELLDLITAATADYNGGTNSAGYTATSWSAFTSAYTAAKSASGSATSTQSAIDTAEANLRTAWDNLELQAYYTVTVTQTGADNLGTVTIDGTSVNAASQDVQVVQGKSASVMITAPAGYYIKSISGLINAENGNTYTGNATVNANGNIDIVYAEDPTVTVAENGGNGTVTINGSTSPVVVDYNTDAALSVTAPELYYIQSVTVNGTPVLTNTDETKTTYTYTIADVTADTTVQVSYAKQTTYNITVESYPATGTLYYNGVAIPTTGTVIEVVAGDNVTITAEPDDGYAVYYWIADSETKHRELTYTFSNIAADHTLDIEWEEIESVTVTATGKPASGGTGKVNGTNSVTVDQYTTVNLVATVTDSRYKFVNWTIEGSYYAADSSTRTDANFNIVATGNVTAVANFTQVYRRIYLRNEANWAQPYVYHFGGSEGDGYPGQAMTYDSALGFWYRDVPMDITGLKFNQGGDEGVQYDNLTVSDNLFTNLTDTTGYPTTYVEPGFYLQGKWNGNEYDGTSLIKFESNGDGTYSYTLTVNSTTDGYIYVNPCNENSRTYSASTAGNTSNPQTLSGPSTDYIAFANRNTVKVEIDTTNYQKAYDVTFTFNPTTGAFSWTKAENIPTISVNGSDGRMTNEADDDMNSPNGRVGDTYFDEDTVNRVSYHTYYDKAEVVAGDPVTFYTQVNKTGDSYDYYVAGWVVNGTEFVPATAMGNGLYSGSYAFTEDGSTLIPVYFHTNEWLAANGVETVTVYAVNNNDITNWDDYMSAYTWYKTSGVTLYEQFGKYTGQVMIPVAGLDGVYYTYIETTSPDGVAISGVTFNNHGDANGNGYDVSHEVDYSHIQTYDYYEFISLLGDGKQNITFVLKDTNDTYNSNRTSTTSINISGGNWDFVQYTDYSGLKTDIFGNDIEDIDSTLSDSNALYIVQAGDKNYSGVGNLDGQWYVDCYLYNATGNYLGKCYSYELHDEDSAIWGILDAYENQRAYISYEHVNGGRYDGEWYGDADVSVTINLAVNVALTENGGQDYTIDNTDPVNEADYGSGYINVSYQSVDVARGELVTLTATPKAGYKFVGWFSANGELFSTNTTYTVTAAIGTTYTAVFEALAEGYFYVNHYIYTGVGTAPQAEIPEAHGGSAVLYVGIENDTQGTTTTLLKGETAYLEATEGDVLYITIATDATGADTFYSWYIDAVDKNGLTTYEEVGVDTDDNLYNNGNTVVGRNDMVYFKFRYVVSDVFSMTLYSDLMPVSVNRKLVYKYNDRYGNIVSYVVPYVLTDQEIEGFAGNNNTPYAPAYISSPTEEWVNTVLYYAPYVEDYYKDATWIIDSASYDTTTFLLWATQRVTMYTVTSQIGENVNISQVPYNTVLNLDARDLDANATENGFWYSDENGNGAYDKSIDIILTYGPYYGYRVTKDMSINYIEVDKLDFNIMIDDPVYGREQETDANGNNKTDKIFVDYLTNILTPYFYDGTNFTPIYNGEVITENWNGNHVTLESLEAAGYEFHYGLILEQVGYFKVGDGAYETYEEALKAAQAEGYGTASSDAIIEMIAQRFVEDGTSKGWDDVNNKNNYYYAYGAESIDITNKNRLLITLSYTNNENNRSNFYNVYGYLAVKAPGSNTFTYYISNAQTLNIYTEGTTDAVVNDNTTFA